ncbi:MAG: hypothetical protein ACXVSA_19840, partial [Solirubrobacteraceae bacterium]
MPARHPEVGAMIGWVILAAVLVPALALGRWADRERRRAEAAARPEAAAVVPARSTPRRTPPPGPPAVRTRRPT